MKNEKVEFLPATVEQARIKIESAIALGLDAAVLAKFRAELALAEEQA
jgi:hypothetical protein